jgi:hypothetical protein
MFALNFSTLYAPSQTATAESFCEVVRSCPFPPGPRIRDVSWTPGSSSLIIGQHDTLSDIVLLEQVQ